MKYCIQIITCLLILGLATTILGQGVNPDYTYEDFQIQFRREYQGEQRQHHKQQFIKNYAEFLQAKKTNSELQVTQFMDWDQTQRANFFNYRPKVSEAKPYPSLRATLATPPITLDYRTLGKVSPIKNQQSCGSCWAFASVAVYESLLLLRQNTLYDLSQQYVIECETSSSGCSGGFSSKALAFLNITGAPLETAYPYQVQSPYYTSVPGNTMCSSTTGNVKMQIPATKIQFISTMTQDQIMQQLTTYGPISVGLKGSWNTFMYAPSSGMINDCPSDSTIDHSVQLVGYTETHWIIKNSWGSYWGDQGFGYINRSSDCGIKRYMVLYQVPQTAPPAPTNVNITVSMTDSRNNGWEGWVLGLKQGTTIVANFTLTTGGSGSKIMQINSQITTKVVVVKAGTTSSSKQIGFTLKFTATGATIYTRPAGYAIYSTTVFTTFCPSATCTTASTAATLYLTSTSGTGWEGSSIQFRQGSQSMSFGQQFDTGKQLGPFTLDFDPVKKVKVVVKTLGNKKNEIGFKLVHNSNGQVISQWKNGKAYSADTLLSQFCLQCDSITSLSTTQAEPTSASIQQPTHLSKLQIGLLSSNCVLFIGCVALVIIILCKIKSIKKSQQQSKNKKSSAAQSASDLHKQNIQNKPQPTE